MLIFNQLKKLNKKFFNQIKKYFNDFFSHSCDEKII